MENEKENTWEKNFVASLIYLSLINKKKKEKKRKEKYIKLIYILLWKHHKLN